MVRNIKRAWIPLLLVVVVAIGTYTIVRIRSTAESPASAAAQGGEGLTEPFNPKHIVYEVTGTGGTVDANYLDENGQPHEVNAATLPWSFEIVTTLPSMSANIVVQGDADVENLRCRVVVDGKVRDDRSTDEYQPFVYCLVKSV